MATLCSISGLYNDEISSGVPFGGFFTHGEGIPGNSPLEDNLLGMLIDDYGAAKIKGTMVRDSLLKFSKQYILDRDYTIEYEFKFDSEKGMWLGEYTCDFQSNKAVCKVNRDIENLQLIGRKAMGSEEFANQMIRSLLERGMIEVVEEGSD